MKHSFLLIICGLLLQGIQWLSAQKVYEGMVYIRENNAEVKNDSVYLDIDINIHGLKVNQRESLYLFPTLFHEADSIKLPPVVLNGAIKQRKINRTIAIEGSYKPQAKAYVVIENTPVIHRVVSYQTSLRHRPWMEKAGLKLIGEFKNQDGETVLILSDLLTDDLHLGR